MTSESFSRPGAVDLSHLASSAQAATSAGPASTGGAAGSYVQQLTEVDFDAVVRKSMQYPVVVELYSPRANAQSLSDDLIELTNQAGGRWLLARVNVDVEQRIAQAMGVQAVPTVVVVIGGQLAPLFQGTKDRAEVQAYLDQVTQVAVSNGLTGRAEPVGSAPVAGDADEAAAPAVDPKYAAADGAMEQGDFDLAVAEYEKILASSPADTDATQGLAQAKLLQRSMSFDPQRIVQQATDEPTNWTAQLDAADLELINGDAAAAFDRVLQVIRETRDEEREAARVRLLELFQVVGNANPDVLKARRKLSTALFA